jgi:site-specific recombinase
MKVKEIYENWKISKKLRYDLNYLLTHMPTSDGSVEDLMIYVQEIFNWIRKPGIVAQASSFLTSSSQKRRIKLLLHILENDPSIKHNFVEVFYKIILNTDPISLLTKIGLVDNDSFFLDLTKRVQRKILPEAPDYANLSYLISSNFESASDFHFLNILDDSQIHFIMSMFGKKTNELNKFFEKQISESILLIAAQVSGLALHSDIRRRMRKHPLDVNPFLKLEYSARDLMKDYKKKNSNLKVAKILEKISNSNSECINYLQDVQLNLEAYGVNTNIVYKVEKMEGQIFRINELIHLLKVNKSSNKEIFQFLLKLIRESVRQRSVISLTKDSLALLSRKITERSAETGVHYIARDSKEFVYLLKKAIGGGAITSFTVLFKFLSSYLPLSGIGVGILSSLNYCFSFLSIQAFGYTLATKQPAMTASTLADKMQNLEQERNIQKLCDGIVLLIRSQFIAVFGNIMAVIPVSIFFHFIFLFCFGSGIISDEKALKTIESFSFFGMTPLYAAFTGVLLFASSLVSGWFDNWFAYHQLEYALSSNRKLRFILGKIRAKQFGEFWKRNIAGISANISLGFMLGMIPVLGEFFLLPLDVRHVTLSTGALSISAAEIGVDVFSMYQFWFSVLGVFSMSILNLGVSFALAMFVAIRARRLNAPNRYKIFHALLTRWKQNPFVFFVPPRED